MEKRMPVDIRSEIGELEGVILHTPGHEVENMTPKNAERSLYSDILNLSVASREYAQFSGVLEKFTRTFQVQDLLADILSNEKIKESLLEKICRFEGRPGIFPHLLGLPPEEGARQLIQGVVEVKDTLTKYLSTERYALRPLHNFFFTRDASMSVLDDVLIGRMANDVRQRESFIMEAIFDYHDLFKTRTVNPLNKKHLSPDTSIEGGDVLVVRDDILLIGNGSRTTSQGIDFILEQLIQQKEKRRHIIVQELPHRPESFIHLDMVFTLLEPGECMVYEPLILKTNKYQTIHIYVEDGRVSEIREEENLMESLRGLGMDLKPILCGGSRDPWIQEREQWHSGANFFAVGPGKVIGYERNVYTLEEMSRHGYEIFRARDILKERVDPHQHDKYVIALDGSELPRGGGGARCMSMPVSRKPVE